jgi:hypothetical protein
MSPYRVKTEKTADRIISMSLPLHFNGDSTMTFSRVLSTAAASALTAVASLAAEPARNIPGYTYGDASLARSPVSMDDLALLQKTVLLTQDDVLALRDAGKVLEPQIDAILDVWYGFVGANPHLLAYFSNPADGKPDARYMERVRARFGQWIRDTTAARYDQAWLDYQYEFALRHTRAKKNQTDGAAAADHIHLRYMIAFIVPISATIEPFLKKGGGTPEQVARMHQAWTKALVLQVALWSQPYVKPGDF